MTYKIAEYLTQEQKERACRYSYAWGQRTEDGYCPLGAALHVELEAAGVNSFYARNPVPYTIAMVLGDGESRGGLDAIREAAVQFMQDWDLGRISNLREALGVGDVQDR